MTAEARTRLITLLDRRTTRDTAHIAAAAWSHADWHDVLELTRRQRVRPQLLARLTSLQLIDRVPPAEQERLRSAVADFARANLLAAADAQQVHMTLAEQGVSALLLKGMHIASLGGASAAREMKDIDILVLENDLTAATAALRALDYTSAPVESSSNSAHLVPFRKAGHREIEVHWRISAPHQPFAEPIDALFRSASTLSWPGTGLRGLSSEHLLLHIATHATYGHACDFGLRGPDDIAALIEARPIDWDSVEAAADRWGARGIWLALHLSARMLGAAVPPALLSRHAPPPEVFADAASQLFSDRDANPEMLTELPLLATGSWSSRLRHAASRVWLDPDSLITVYGRPWAVGGLLLWRLRRLAWLLRRHGRSAGVIALRANPALSDFAARKERLLRWIQHDAPTGR